MTDDMMVIDRCAFWSDRDWHYAGRRWSGEG